MLQNCATDILGRSIKLPRHQTRQIPVHRPDGRRDRHVVIVENHQQINVRCDTCIIHRLERHASGQRTITNDSDMLARNTRIT